MKTKLTILGSGSSVGTPRLDGHWGNCSKLNKKNNRTRCCAFISKGSNSILIDVSPDIRSQLLKNKISNITAAIITHEHADQTNGLFELRPFYWKNKKKVNIYGDTTTINHLKKRNEYLFRQVDDYKPILKAIIIKNKFSIGNYNEKIIFEARKVKHGLTHSLAYIFEKTAYISDVNDLSIINMKELHNLNFLIIDCLKFTKHPSHFNLTEALFIHSRLKPKKTILTNLHYDLDYNNLIKKLPTNVIPAYDGLKIDL